MNGRLYDSHQSERSVSNVELRERDPEPVSYLAGLAGKKKRGEVEDGKRSCPRASILIVPDAGNIAGNSAAHVQKMDKCPREGVILETQSHHLWTEDVRRATQKETMKTEKDDETCRRQGIYG
ncbi:predicted protein [Histoplasma mississippiense (nom. inval.)]|uniref:predicted protein n=1 Tax=Ajellomyces capsulatus (strain NAm1 / WU24) TaxID=2059318 RepID=UPI000157D4F8|nr:predicted protein [Histoplasma mississippiense (nom. inval.)]EDN05107.1 predicted protein [Histoplasma mississippiense (nom. inval.)]